MRVLRSCVKRGRRLTAVKRNDEDEQAPGGGGTWSTKIRGRAARKSKKLPCPGVKFPKMIPCPGVKFS